jgi:hypothetical protein
MDSSNPEHKSEPFHIDINSNNKVTGTSTNFYIKLPLPPNQVFNRVVLCSCIIPKVFYNVQDKYNTFTLIENGVSIDIKLTPSDYTPYNLASILSTELSASSLNGFGYVVTFPVRNVPQTGKFTFTVSNNFGVQPQFYFNGVTSLYEQMGFQSNKYYPFDTNTLTSENVIFLQSERSIFLHSDMVDNPFSNVLQEIYATINPTFSSIVFNQTDYHMSSRKFKGNNSGIFNFTLTDENDIPINIGTLSFQFSIVLF